MNAKLERRDLQIAISDQIRSNE